MLTSRRVAALILIFIFFVCQNFLSLIFPSVPFPLMISAVVFYALAEGAGFGLAAGLWAGFLLEVFVVGKFGFQMALWGAAGFFTGFLSTKIFPDSLPAQLFVPVLAQTFVSGMNLYLRGRWGVGLGELFMTALCALILFHWLPRRRRLR